jgi:hypothetical protein
MRANTSGSQARGSTSFNLAVTIREYTAAARSPPRSEPANSQCFSAQGYATQCLLGCIVRKTNPSIIEEPAERGPTLQHVFDRLRQSYPGALRVAVHAANR